MHPRDGHPFGIVPSDTTSRSRHGSRRHSQAGRIGHPVNHLVVTAATRLYNASSPARRLYWHPVAGESGRKGFRRLDRALHAMTSHPAPRCLPRALRCRLERLAAIAGQGEQRSPCLPREQRTDHHECDQTNMSALRHSCASPATLQHTLSGRYSDAWPPADIWQIAVSRRFGFGVRRFGEECRCARRELQFRAEPLVSACGVRCGAQR